MKTNAQVMAELNVEGHINLVSAFEQTCKEHLDKQAFYCLGEEISFSQMDQRSANFGAYLLSVCGLQAGDRIAIQLPNIIQYPIAVWGALRAGLIVVNTNPQYTAREQIHQFNDSGATALVVLEALLPTTQTVLPETGIKKVISSKMLADPSDSVTSFAEALSEGAKYSLPISPATMKDVAVLQYTGGTTGPSKGAMLSHENLYAGMMMGRKSVVLADDGRPEIALAPLPLYHVFGFTQHIVGTLLHGGLSVLIPDPRDMDGMIKTMQRYRFSNINGVNTLLQGMMAHPQFDDIDFSNLTGTIAGGTTLVKEIGEEWEARTGTRIFEGYGLSETTAGGTCNRPESNELGTVGPAIEYQEIKVVDANGQTVAHGEPGEVCLRGPNVMQGYWQREDANAETFDDEGYLKTGDIGILQSNGRLSIVDRIKDMIIVSGFNVFPNEVEEVVYGHPAVFECAAIGVPDSHTGEAIRLFVVSREPSLTAEAIIAFCRTELAAYKVPKQILFEDDLPKSPAGKILRRELRDRN